MKREDFFAISPSELQPNWELDFDIYLKRRDNYIKYLSKGDYITERIQNKLMDIVSQIYVPDYYEEGFGKYLHNNLGNILQNQNVDIKERSKIFHKVASDAIGSVYENTQIGVSQEELENIRDIVDESVDFLEDEKALKGISELFDFDYTTFAHCLHVFTYTLGLLSKLDIDRETLIKVGVGALLHDIGKKKIPSEILNKKGKLSNIEWLEIKNHPLYGVSECKHIGITQEATNCILFHHEKYDGSGYPMRISGEDIPFYVRVLTICDVYDAITSNRPYAEAQDPFNALDTMCNMEGFFDQDLLEKFIKMLGNINEK